jgi:hypothetical protein
LDQGKRYPERFDRRVIRICMGNNEVSDGSDSAESKILIIDWWEAEVAEKGKRCGRRRSIVGKIHYTSHRIMLSLSTIIVFVSVKLRFRHFSKSDIFVF